MDTREMADAQTQPPAAPEKSSARGMLPRGSALKFVVLLGIVSLFADMTHEGARGITGPFLATLGASATIVGIIAGLGELLGYVLRFPFGAAADRTGKYWPITFIGYGVQMVAVPLLALAGSWPIAALLMITERSGRAMRNPARDAMLAHTADTLGGGWAFGLREALDATGGMLGPLIVAVAVFISGGYRGAFAILVVPALLTLVVLVAAQRLYPHPHNLEAHTDTLGRTRFPRVYWIYLVGMGLIAVAYADFPLIAFHFSKAATVPPAWIPVLYAMAMGTEAVAALVWGRLFDRIGLLTVVAATVLTAFFAPLVFLGSAALAVVGMVLWGLGMAAQESIVKAAITGMVGGQRRATAYGLFDTGFGICWFVGSVALGILYDHTVVGLVVFSVVLQLLALPFLFWTARRMRRLA